MASSNFRITQGLTVQGVEVIDSEGQLVQPSTVQTMRSLTDIDFTGLQDDGLLMWDISAEKWIITKHLDTHSIDAGTY